MRPSLALWLLITPLACVGQVGDDQARPDAGPPRDAGSAAGDASLRPDATPDAAPTLYDLLDPEEQQLFDLINEERTSRGLTAVTLRDTLICAARHHSDDIGSIHICTHTGSDGSGPGDRVDDCGGGGWTGEIVACGQTTPRDAVDAWLGSPGHRAIMLDGSKREVGVAMTDDYWTAIFDD